MSLCLCGCATVPREGGGPGAAREVFGVTEICRQNNFSLQWDTLSGVATISSPKAKVLLLADSAVVILDDRVVVLDAPVRMLQGVMVVPPDFSLKVLNRLRAGGVAGLEDYSFPRVRKVILDAGHGGKDPGTTGRTGIVEKKIVLDIVDRLERILTKKGFKVVLTRDRDDFISLQERTEIASRSDADLFVSVHANSSPSRAVNGLEVFFLKDLSEIDKEEAQRRDNQKLLFDHMEMRRNDKQVKEILDDMMYDYKQAAAKTLAVDVSRTMADEIRVEDRGQKASHFFVLRNTLIPAVLVEVGFLSNPKEEKLLDTGSYRQDVAEALAKSIMKYASK